MNEKLFPIELLNKAIEDRKQYFTETTLNHKSIDDSLNQLLQLINEPGSGGLVLVIGPTGVGKTTLLQLTHKAMYRLPHAENSIPAIATELVAPDRGSFKFKDFYIRSLQELREPLIDKKILLPNGISDTTDTSPERYRRSLENALYYRQTRAFLIDEAQHFGSVTSGRGFIVQTDSLKSLANMSKTLLVLFGSYDLLTLRGESGQLIRRAPYIHLARYDARNERDRKSFKEALKGLEQRLPVESQEPLLDDWAFFYERSAGCIGVLKDWFKMALWDTLTRGKKSVSVDIFRKYSLSLEECKTLANEINEGERLVKELQAENKAIETELWALYGIDKEQLKKEDLTRTRKGSKPGVQNPKRHRSGEGLKHAD